MINDGQRMSDHHDHPEPVAGPWAGGWLIAALAAVAAVGMTELVTQVGAPALIAVAALTFFVTGFLCGNGGVELTHSEDHGKGNGHGDHSHDHH
jgi:hypothetical protein